MSAAQAVQRRIKNVPGAVVDGVGNNTPARRAGLQVNDVITAVDGQAVKSARDLLRLLAPRDVLLQLVADFGRGVEGRLHLLLHLVDDGSILLGALRGIKTRFAAIGQELRPELADLLRHQLSIAPRHQSVDAKALRPLPDNIQSIDTNGAGGAENSKESHPIQEYHSFLAWVNLLRKGAPGRFCFRGLI